MLRSEYQEYHATGWKVYYVHDWIGKRQQGVKTKFVLEEIFYLFYFTKFLLDENDINLW